MRQSAHGHTHQGVRGWGGGGRLQLPQQLYNKYISHDIVAAAGWEWSMFDGDDMGKKLNENQSVYELCD